MAKKLPARPNLDHLRRQAKVLLEEERATRGADFRLADAQFLVAKKNGFANWPALARHVEQLRALEGDWRFASLEIDGAAMPKNAFGESRLLIDGDRFRTESPEATYDGIFTIDVEATPPHIDIEFVEGPEAGNHCYGLYELDGDRLQLCLGLVGATRPSGFATHPGSGFALERLYRASSDRPEHVSGGTPQPPPVVVADREDPSSFDIALTPLLRQLEGEWAPTRLVQDGKPMPDQWLSFGSRTATGNEVKVVFGGQVMLHVKVRIDEGAMPMAVDYLSLRGAHRGTVTRGIFEWAGDVARFLIAGPGQPRPSDFSSVPAGATLSEWRRR